MTNPSAPQPNQNRELTLQDLANKIDLIGEKLELYKRVNDQQQENNKEYINSIRAEIKAYQDANKQQLNVSLGVLATAAIAVLASVVISSISYG